MNADDIKRRTEEFAKRIIMVCRALPKTEEGRLFRGQLFRVGTAVGANYRAACRGRSRADFISKLGIVLEEADESLYWLELIVETAMMKESRLLPLMNEAAQLVSIFVASLNTAKKRR
jgi:four helix bundle protein